MRARNIKPDFFLDEELVALPFETRLLFAGLWCCADKAGRLEDRPVRIRAMVFPYEKLDVDKMLTALAKSGQIIRYTVNGGKFIQIKAFTKHQSPHHTEKDSIIPECNGDLTVKQPSDNGEPTPKNGSNPPDSLIPDSGLMNPDSPIPETPLRGPQAAPAGDDGFESFWKSYPVNRDKKAEARKSWLKLKPNAELQAKILSALDWQRKQPKWVKDNGDFVPMAVTYLNQRRWEDEPPAGTPGAPPKPKPPRMETDMDRALARMAREMVDE